MSEALSPKRQRVRRAASLLLLLAALAGGALLVKQQLGSGAPDRIAEGVRAPEISVTIPGSDGPVQLSDYKGRTVLVHFWATWCEPCKRELPVIDEAAKLLAAEGGGRSSSGAAGSIGADAAAAVGSGSKGGGTGGTGAVLAINVGDSRGTMNEFLSAVGIKMPIASDVTGEAAAAFRVNALPVSFVVSPDGRILRIVQGEFKSVEEILDIMDKAG
ncbi:TlpA family protein disulfide reductase [Paenibacillus pasadenensis]|uniref:TlpA family protein disulfide reductase n=1 Tax=Paenibacillus pasadenensis TaxID=217090 RepID=UPI00203EF077|nr:TlpA disulfide reductase family protein [Paenibacillus pasadenensis]MCM3747979.1 TlpA family protein disulfide reductase [Paenibacillus pasadenensis]